MKHLALALLPLLTSCAAMMGTGPVTIPVSSDPPGATVVYNGNDVGITPCSFSMKHRDREFALRLDGYHRHDVDVGGKGNGGLVVLGFLLWGPLEFVFDAAAGAFSRPDDGHVHIVLVPAAEPRPAKWIRPPDPNLVSGRKNWKEPYASPEPGPTAP